MTRTNTQGRRSSNRSGFEKKLEDIEKSIARESSKGVQDAIQKKRIEAARIRMPLDERARQARRGRAPRSRKVETKRNGRDSKRTVSDNEDGLDMDHLSRSMQGVAASKERRDMREAATRMTDLEEQLLQDQDPGQFEQYMASKPPTALQHTDQMHADQLDHEARDITHRPRKATKSAVNSDVEMEEKDDAEMELERMVFGDSAGFRDNIKQFGRSKTKEESSESENEVGGGVDLSGVPDQDLFFTDVAGGFESSSLSRDDDDIQMLDAKSDDSTGLSRRAVWHDSDDDRINISLASVPRLRKLRVTADEDVVSGKEYIRRLRKQYTLLNPTPDWVIEARQQPANKRRRLSIDERADGSDYNDTEGSDDEEVSSKPLIELLRSSNGLVKTSSSSKNKRRYHPGTLSVERTPDIGTTQPSAVTSISLHPSLPLLLSSGPSGTLYLHQLIQSPPAETANPLLTSLHIKGTPLSTTAFHPTNSKIFLSARRRYFHIWDLKTGRVEKVSRVYGQAHEQHSMETFKLSPDGQTVALLGSGKKGGGIINFLSATTLQWTSQVRIESLQGVADYAWWSDSRGLTVAGKNGEITEWNFAAEEVVGRYTDQGAIGTTVIALGGQTGRQGSSATIGPDRWLAVGSSSGIVNLYDRKAWYETHRVEGSASICPARPQPCKVLESLTTPISDIVFSPDGQLMCFGSRWKKDALRLVHLPSRAVYTNWPTSSTPLGRVTGVTFGRIEDGKGDATDVLVIGNEAGKVRMWELRP